MTDGTSAIGTIHFALMALLAVVVVIGIIWGVKSKRSRVQGQKEVEAHAEEAGVAVNPPGAEPSPPAPASTPVAPSPPPLADQPAPATPPNSAASASARAFADEPPHANPLADEPIAAAIAPDGTTVTLAADAAVDDVATGSGEAPGDAPLTQIKGLGPKVAARMGELGIDRVGQLAALDDAGVRDLDAQLGPFTGRIMRDRWVEQARLLAAGDREAFERAFGKLG